MNSQTTVRLVIGVLGALAVIVVAGGIVLALDDKSLPESLIAIGSAAAGSVAAMLARTGESTEVRVMNDPADPVPVEPT